MLKEKDQKALDEFLKKYKAWQIDYDLSYDTVNPVFTCPGPATAFLNFDGFKWNAFVGMKVMEEASSDSDDDWWRVEKTGSISFGDTPEEAVKDLQRALRVQATAMLLDGSEEE